jgi:hypothetical protein
MIYLTIIIVDKLQVFHLYSWKMELVLNKQRLIRKLVARIDSQKIVAKWKDNRKIKRRNHKQEQEVSLLNIVQRTRLIIVNIIKHFSIILRKKQIL